MPNLFLVGAPRCATTSLAAFLASHPQIQMSRKKEPHYFGSDLHDPSSVKDRDDYLALFREEDEPTKYRADGSVWYLYSQTAAEEIRAVSPDAKILIALRDPFEMMASLHAKHVFTGHQKIKDFTQAYRTYCADTDVPKTESFRNTICYRTAADFHPQIMRFVEQFGRENVHFCLFDDLIASPDQTTEAILAFLGLSGSDELVLPQLNTGRKKSDALPAKLYRSIRFRASKVLGPLPGVKFALKAIDKVASPQDARLPAPSIPEELRQEIEAALRPGVTALEELLSRPLHHWMRL